MIMYLIICNATDIYLTRRDHTRFTILQKQLSNPTYVFQASSSPTDPQRINQSSITKSLLLHGLCENLQGERRRIKGNLMSCPEHPEKAECALRLERPGLFPAHGIRL